MVVRDVHGNEFLAFVNIYPGRASIAFTYDRSSPDITDTVNSIIPSPFAEVAITSLVAARMLWNAGESNEAIVREKIAIAEIKRLYFTYASNETKFRGKISTSPKFYLHNA